MMSVDAYYVRILQVGFLVLRQAMESGCRDWADAELEMLHNIPSLLGETNPERHRYYWTKERTHYMNWVTNSGLTDAQSRMRTLYEPIWNEMAFSIEELLAHATEAGRH